jgi:UDP-glucose 4-epimerase
VTGATGFVGAHLVRRLLAERWSVAALVRAESDTRRIDEVLDRIEVLGGGLEQLDDAALRLRRFAPQVVFHVGWSGVGSKRHHDPKTIEANVGGSVRLIDIACDAGCTFVGLGSQAEYGGSNDVLTEETPLRPETLYAACKVAVAVLGEQLCAIRGTRFVWLRLLSAYGPMDSADHLIPYVISSLLHREQPALTSCEQRWDYLYVADVADALVRAAVSRSVAGSYVLASGTAPPLRRTVESVRDLIDCSLPIGFGEVLGPTRELRGDPSRFARLTGWTVRVTLEEGLRRTVEWHRNGSEHS